MNTNFTVLNHAIQSCVGDRKFKTVITLELLGSAERLHATRIFLEVQAGGATIVCVLKMIFSAEDSGLCFGAGLSKGDIKQYS